MNDVSKESKIQCVQLVNLTSFAGQEDCLFLNIYVPETVYNDPFPGAPVMVFIHGGGLVSIKKYISISIICIATYFYYFHLDKWFRHICRLWSSAFHG